jgi:hypothetical protein
LDFNAINSLVILVVAAGLLVSGLCGYLQAGKTRLAYSVSRLFHHLFLATFVGLSDELERLHVAYIEMLSDPYSPAEPSDPRHARDLVVVDVGLDRDRDALGLKVRSAFPSWALTPPGCGEMASALNVRVAAPSVQAE